MNPKKPVNPQPSGPEPVAPSEIRFSPHVRAAAEKIAGRSLRSNAPVLPKHLQREE